jgi:uncharacterized membrane protein
MTTFLEIVALASTALFAGAAVYVTFVEHPARVSCGTAIAVAQFRPSYRRGAVMQGGLAFVGLAASVAAWAENGDRRVLFAGLLLGSLIPYTLLVILPTNKKLLDPSLDARSPEAAALLARWGRLHSIRTIVGLLAFGLLIFALFG